MKFPRNKQIFRGQLDLAAFAGVFFVLLIFVMLNSSLISTPGIPIDLPAGEELSGVAGRTLVVAVDPNGQFYFKNQLTSEHLLQRRLSEEVNAAREPITLVVQADRSVPFDRILKLGGLASKAGIRSAHIATRPSLSGTNSPAR
jgi:biopolymer transport protein ExbD